jgi:hypothetical protein
MGDLHVAGKRADAHPVAIKRDAPKRVEPVDVNQQLGLRETHVEGGHEALPAGQDARLIAVLVQQPHGVCDALRHNVAEPRRLHARSRSLDAVLINRGVDQAAIAVCATQATQVASAKGDPPLPGPPCNFAEQEPWGYEDDALFARAGRGRGFSVGGSSLPKIEKKPPPPLPVLLVVVAPPSKRFQVTVTLAPTFARG